MVDADWARESKGQGNKRVLATIWPTLACWFARDNFGTTLTVTITLYWACFFLGYWLAERRAAQQSAPFSPYQGATIVVSPFWRRWFFILTVAVQLPLCWVLIGQLRRSTGLGEMVASRDLRLLMSAFLEVCYFYAIAHMLWHTLRRRPTAWSAELQVDPAGLHVPGFLRRPIAWSEIAQIRLAWEFGYPYVVLRLRQLPGEDLVLRRGPVRRCNDRRDIRLSLTGWTLGAQALHSGIKQRWQAFGDVSLAEQGIMLPAADRPASGAGAPVLSR